MGHPLHQKSSNQRKDSSSAFWLPQTSSDGLFSDSSQLNNLFSDCPLLPEAHLHFSDIEDLFTSSEEPAMLPEHNDLAGLSNSLQVYRPGEYLPPQVKSRAQTRNLAPPFRSSDSQQSSSKNRQQLIRCAEEILVEAYPLRADGEQLYLCENCVWKPVTPSQLWRRLRSSDLSQQLEVEFFTNHDMQELYRRLLANNAIHFDDTHRAPLDSIEGIINLEDICFHVNTTRTIPQDPGYFFTTNLSIRKSDLVEFETPYFDEFIQSTFLGDNSLRELFLEILGTFMSNYRPKNVFVFCGASNSGKSVIVDFLRLIIGVPSITQIAHLRDFSSRWTIGNLKGKKLLICTECSDEFIGPDACAVIKTITGEPTLTGEQKHKDAATFTNTTRLLLVSNHLVRLDRVDAGFANRLVTMPFPCSIPFEQQDPDLLQHLLEEKGGIFMMAMKALKELIARNFEYTHVAPAYLERIGDQKLYIAENFDAGVKQFVEKCCVLESGVYLASNTLYEAYRKFAEANNFPFYTKAHVFCKTLYRLFTVLKAQKKYVDGKQCRCIQGIALQDSVDTDKLSEQEDISHE